MASNTVLPRSKSSSFILRGGPSFFLLLPFCLLLFIVSPFEGPAGDFPLDDKIIKINELNNE